MAVADVGLTLSAWYPTARPRGRAGDYSGVIGAIHP